MYPLNKNDLNTRIQDPRPTARALPDYLKDSFEKFSTMLKENATPSERSAILSALRSQAEELRTQEIQDIKGRVEGAKKEIELMEKDSLVRIQELEQLIF